MNGRLGKTWTLLAATAACCLPPAATSAQGQRFVDRFEFTPGVARLEFDIDVESLAIAGFDIPDADLDVSSSTLPSVTIAFNINENWSIGTLVAPPPEARIKAAGSLDFLDLDIGTVRYLPVNVAVQYRFTNFGAFRPFLGVGAAYFLVLATEDDETSGLEVDDALGGVLRAGFDFAVNENVSLHFAYSKVFLETQARTTLPFLFDVPTEVELSLDPSVVEAGLTIRF
ncbi:outer membrane protein W [Hasllibacter halocynthiae]|uniref:Outer membrane protein W n=1 Tax=Hasllibacter halocynthiae TaxID=595589 RepID=A0A2T0WZD8_9RHOB|nr:OmpW family outer membrane protein [Hasllibacter halocynthiae]PRY92051.1 outer membrane protein W [Hasllibacter halocynthiae]